MSVVSVPSEIVGGGQDALLLPLTTSKKGGGLPSRISESGYIREAGLMFPDAYVEFAHRVWEGDQEWGSLYVKEVESSLGINKLYMSPALDTKEYKLTHLKKMVLNLYRISEGTGQRISTAWPFRCRYVNFTLADYLNEMLRYDWGGTVIMFHDRNAITRAQLYADLGIPIIPCIKEAKDPKVSGWVRSIEPREFHDYILADDNIAVKLGSDSGLAAVDFDYDIKGVKDKVLSVLPPPECVKLGSKGLTAFYKLPAEGMKSTSFWYNGLQGKIPVVEVLAEGRKTIIPPSVHPNTRLPYRWEGKTLLKAVADGNLQELTEEMVSRIREIALGAGCYERSGGLSSYGNQDIDGF